MTEGDMKYGGYNYRDAGASVSTYIASTLRHLFKYYGGEWADEDTKVPHLASALSGLAIIIDAHTQGVLVDDRPPFQDVAGLLEEFKEIVIHLGQMFPDGPARFTEANE
jgi:hypothetical protein